MILIQIILILAFIVFLFRFLSNPSSYQIRAWTKILAVLFVILAVITVLFPNSTNAVAHWLGISRGADLLLYFLTLVVIFFIFNSYIQEKRLQKKIVILARKIAIMEANHKKIK
jgi:hypothetical protein